MKINDKLLAITFWVLSSSAFLWLMTIVQPHKLPPKPGLDDLFISYFWFALLTFSAGSAYHVTTALIATSFNSKYLHLWKKLKKNLGWSTILFLVLIVGLIFIRDYFPNSYSFLIGIVYYVFMFPFYLLFFFKACESLKQK